MGECATPALPYTAADAQLQRAMRIERCAREPARSVRMPALPRGEWVRLKRSKHGKRRQ